jgi:hypothetical protein
VFEKVGAGEGNRTLVISLEGIWRTVLDQSELKPFSITKTRFLIPKLTVFVVSRPTVIALTFGDDPAMVVQPPKEGK